MSVISSLLVVVLLTGAPPRDVSLRRFVLNEPAPHTAHPGAKALWEIARRRLSNPMPRRPFPSREGLREEERILWDRYLSEQFLPWWDSRYGVQPRGPLIDLPWPQIEQDVDLELLSRVVFLAISEADVTALVEVGVWPVRHSCDGGLEEGLASRLQHGIQLAKECASLAPGASARYRWLGDACDELRGSMQRRLDAAEEGVCEVVFPPF